MPYVAPSTVVAGQTYSAASHNVIVNDIIDHEDRLDTVQNAQYPFRNVLLNGAMNVQQRSTSISGITSGNVTYNTADRWSTSVSANGTWTNAITADTPTGSGFRSAFRMTATVSAATAAPSYVIIQQRLEGQTLQHIKKGTANAQQLTLQFWVKSNRTGTYVAELIDNDNTRQVSASYTVNATDTWEQKTITFPADTTGAFDNDANYSMALNFWLSAGTDYATGSLATSWGATTNATRAVGQTNVAGATNGYWQVTGVQLEPGSQASPFEFLPYGDELARCQRYYWKLTIPAASDLVVGQAYGARLWNYIVRMPVSMRTTPVEASVSTAFAAANATNSAVVSGTITNTVTLNRCTPETIYVYCSGTSGATLTAGDATTINNTSASPADVIASAEL